MSKKKTITIGNHKIGVGQPVFVIAEAGVNHNKSLVKAKKLVDIAKAAGADAVKFQTWKVDELYVSDEISGKPLRKESSKRALSYSDFTTLKTYCDKKGILFLSTPDEEMSADFLSSIDVPAFKVGSGELPNIPFLAHIAKKGKPIILSTGMAMKKDIDKAVHAIKVYNSKLILLHAISSYPTLPKDVVLGRIKKLRDTYHVLTGFSDHTLGNVGAILAVGQGACVIEKHFTFNKMASGPDHAMSLDPKELKDFINCIREAEAVCSKKEYSLTTSEKRTKSFAWKSAVARQDIRVGEQLSLENVIFKRPGSGITVDKWETIRGKKAKHSLSKGSFLRMKDLT